MLAATPWPVTRPIRALTTWMPIMSGIVRRSDQRSP
jgi:hypothetical protein